MDKFYRNFSKVFDWIGDNSAGFLLGCALCFVVVVANAHDWTYKSPYEFPVFQKDIITMDVVKNDGVRGGGTYRCTSIYKCYMYTMAAEQRGATQYCKTITIKKNGRKVWFKRYN